MVLARAPSFNVEKTPGKRLVARFPAHFGVCFARLLSRLIVFSLLCIKKVNFVL